MRRFDAMNNVVTNGASNILKIRQVDPVVLLDRHYSGDWGNMDKDDKAMNERAVKDGSRIMSSYDLGSDDTIWVITEAEDDRGLRSVTTLLLPEEY